MLKNKKGSAIIWAIAVILVLAVTVAAGLTVAYSYYNRTLTLNNKRQAYLTGKGVIEDIVEKIEVGNSDYTDFFTTLSDGERNQLTVTFPSELDDYGKIKVAEIEKIEKENIRGFITITITATYAGQDNTMKADMQLGKINGFDKWQLVRYYDGNKSP